MRSEFIPKYTSFILEEKNPNPKSLFKSDTKNERDIDLENDLLSCSGDGEQDQYRRHQDLKEFVLDEFNPN